MVTDLLGEDVFKHVTDVALQVSQVTDAGLENLKGLKKLQGLDLAMCQITDAGLGNLKSLNELEWLNLDNTRITDSGLGNLKGLNKLHFLGLSNTKVTDSGLGDIITLNQLDSLDLGWTKVTDAGLSHLKGLNQLQFLGLRATTITDAGLAHLKELHQLQLLILIETNVTPAGVKQLHQALPNCEIRRLIPNSFPPIKRAFLGRPPGYGLWRLQTSNMPISKPAAKPIGRGLSRRGPCRAGSAQRLGSRREGAGEGHNTASCAFVPLSLPSPDTVLRQFPFLNVAADGSCQSVLVLVRELPEVFPSGGMPYLNSSLTARFSAVG